MLRCHIEIECVHVPNRTKLSSPDVSGDTHVADHSQGPAPARVRRGLQPRTVAGKRLAGGRPAHAGGGRHHGERRDLLLGPPRTGARPVRLRLARPAPRPAPRARRPRRPGHADRGAARLVLPRPPGGPARHRRGGPPLLRLTRGDLSQLLRLPRGRRRHHHRAGPPLRHPPGARALARPQRVRRARQRLLLRRLRRPLPPLAGPDVRLGRGRERGLGHRLLGPALLLVRGDRPAPGHPDRRQPGPAARLPPLRRRHHPRELPDGTGHPARTRPRHPRHHQLHDGAQPVRLHRLLGLGPRGRPRHQRPLPDHRRPPHPRQPGDGRRPHPLRRRRRPGCSWSTPRQG